MTDYQQKYLKYKNKYIELKNEINGGALMSSYQEKLDWYNKSIALYNKYKKKHDKLKADYQEYIKKNPVSGRFAKKPIDSFYDYILDLRLHSTNFEERAEARNVVDIDIIEKNKPLP